MQELTDGDRYYTWIALQTMVSLSYTHSLGWPKANSRHSTVLKNNDRAVYVKLLCVSLFMASGSALNKVRPSNDGPTEWLQSGCSIPKA